jgi:putative proteasome-type protease
MTYCLGIMTREGLVMASDSRANAGFDQVNVCPKMHTFLQPGERAFVILTSPLSLCCAMISTPARD